MKANNLKSLISIMFISMLMMTNVSIAQRGNGNGNNCGGNYGSQPTKSYNSKDVNRIVNNIPNVTDTQKEQITTLQTAFNKDMLPLRNQLNEQQARLKTLSSAEKADPKEINKQIDKISATKNQMMKRGSKFQQDVRVLLTDDQRVYLDTQKAKRNGNRKGKRSNRGCGSSCGK